jgi:hypothetical protein
MGLHGLLQGQLYIFYHKSFVVSPSDECINHGITDAGSFGCNTLEILMLSGFLRFRLPVHNYVYECTFLIGSHSFN